MRRSAGAVAGAMLLVLFHGAWLLVPFGVLAALLPYGRSRNYGLLATFLTPLVVVLVDLLKPIGWRLAGDRLIDTLIGCAIVLLVGFAPWPMSWYAHLPGKFGQGEAASSGTPLPAGLELPDDETLKPITEAVRALLGVLASGERLGGPR